MDHRHKRDGKKIKVIGGDRSGIVVVASAMLFIAMLIVVGGMLIGLVSNYRNNTMLESASHLKEINLELQLYIEAKINGDWDATHGIVNGIASGNLNADEEILAFILRERDIWGVSNITLYTESGSTVSTDGSVITNDVASEAVVEAQRLGEYLTIKESTLIFIVKVNTNATYHGSVIKAVSVVHNLDSFLDNMNISSFNGSAFFYLTQSNGTVISKLTNENADDVYNLLPLLYETPIVPLSDTSRTSGDPLLSGDCTVFLRTLDTGDQYVVSTPIRAGSDEMRLFYFVPTAVVNQTSDSFSKYMITLSTVVMAVFAVGSVIVFYIIYISRKRQFDKELALRENMLALLVQNSKSAFALLTVNQAKPRFYSGNAEKIIGEDYYNLCKTDSGYSMTGSSFAETNARRALNEQLKGWDGLSEFRSAFIRNDKASVPTYFEIQVFPVKSDESVRPDGQRGEYVGIAQDVTPLYEQQTAATEALALAEQANKSKTRFLSNMSHDIRTPMNAIVNMTNFARESAGDPKKQIEYLDCLSESSDHLLSLINDVLDMSRIESGKVVIAQEPVDLKAELVRVADMIRPLCISKSQRLSTDFSGINTAGILGDKVKLSQILMNLLSNANKFTPVGGEVVFKAAELPSLKSSVVNIRFTVKDTGIGIAKENLQAVFDPFTRIENAQECATEGTGLGLSICKSYVTAMGGSIWCESVLGSGSTFTVELYFKKAAAPAAEAEASVPVSETPFTGRRCLLCEDNKINRSIATKLLQNLGFTVYTANDGREGFDKFLSSPSGFYDVIYMDIFMPVMDGYTAAVSIRGSEHPQSKTVPIIAMTANVFAEDVEKARASGMNGHLGKPIIVADLISVTGAALLRKR